MDYKLYLLRPKGYTPNFEEGAWQPWYDKAFGFVVCALSETSARALAAQMVELDDRLAAAWLDPNQSTCEELVPTGQEEIIIEDFRRA